MTRTEILDVNDWCDASDEAEYLARLKAEKRAKKK